MYSESEISYLTKLNGVERIRASLCLEKTLLPDETPRIFGTAGDLMTYIYSAGNKNPGSRKHINELKKDAIFSAYLEDEEFGMMLLGAAICEAVGVAISPVTIPAMFLGNMIFEQLIKPSYRFVRKCADVEREIEALGVYVTRAVPWIDMNETAYREVPMEFCTEPVHDVSRFLMAAEMDPDSIQFQIALALDLSSNSYVMGIMDYLHPYVISPLWWGFSIMLQAPAVYYDYYIGISWTKPTCATVDRHQYDNESSVAMDCHVRHYLQLPPTRDACLLRAALEAGKVELSELKLKLRNELIRQNEGLLSSLTNKKKEMRTKSGVNTLNAMVKRLLGQEVTNWIGELYGNMFTYLGISNLYSDNLFDSNDEYERELVRLQAEVKGMDSHDSNASYSKVMDSFMKWLDGLMYNFLISLQSFGQTVLTNFLKELSILFGDQSHEFQWLKAFDRSDTENYYKIEPDANDISLQQKKWYDIDFGSDSAWQVLYDNTGSGNSPITPPCISKTMDKYNYEFCYFKTVKQNNVIMGTFDRWEYVSDADSDELLLNSISDQGDVDKSTLAMNNMLYRSSIANGTDGSIGGLLQNRKSNKHQQKKKNKTVVVSNQKANRKHNYNYQIYNNGDTCHANGKQVKRTTHVYYYCSNLRDGEIIDVRELETCVYSVLIYTPFACNDEHERYSLHYLDYLGVFGFH